MNSARDKTTCKPGRKRGCIVTGCLGSLLGMTAALAAGGLLLAPYSATQSVSPWTAAWVALIALPLGAVVGWLLGQLVGIWIGRRLVKKLGCGQEE